MPRKRKAGPREPSGRPSRRRDDVERVAFEQGPMQTVLQSRRRQMRPFVEPSDPPEWRRKATASVSKEEARDHRLMHRGSVLDRLWADGAISDAERAAGLDYGQRYLRFAALYGLPPATPKGAAMDGTPGGRSLACDSAERARAARREHEHDRAALGVPLPFHIATAVHRACVLDEPCDVASLRAGLAALIAAGR